MMLRIAFIVGAFVVPFVAQAQPRPDAFVDAATVVPNLGVDMRYFGADNFVGKRIDGYERPICLLTKEAATALTKVARDLEPRGLALKVFDCYRPARAVAHFVRWAQNVADVARKAEAQTNRAILAQAMRRGGFVPYAREWWHFTLRAEPFPDRHFDFPVK